MILCPCALWISFIPKKPMGTLTNTYFILDEKLQESCRKASIICPESKIEALGGCKRTPEQLCAQLNRLNQRLQSESQRY